MLPDFLSQYLRDIESATRRLEGAYVERYEEEIVAPNRVNLRIRVRFPSGHMLELNEAVIAEGGNIIHLGYRYHLQDAQNSLVFRYDKRHISQRLRVFPITSTFQTK